MRDGGREQYSPEDLIEAKFGREIIEDAADISRAIYGEMKRGLANIGLGEGTSNEQRQRALEYLSMWRDFYHGVLTRTSSSEHRSPDRLATAIKGATALLSPELTDGDREAAEEMISGLRKRFR